MWNLSLDHILLNEDLILENLTLLPSKSVTTTYLSISDTDRPILLAIKTNSSKQIIEEKIRATSGIIVNSSQFSGELFSHPKLTSKGNYSVILSNLGIRPVKIDLLFGYVHESRMKVNANGQSGNLEDNVMGSYLMIMGMIFLITGIGIRAAWLIDKGR